jgi:predicted anti-sigma-YlaC factor YlaD
MKCNKVHKNLIFYIDGELSSEMTQKVREHLSKCQECNKLYEKMNEAWKGETSESIPYQPFFYTRVKEGLRNRKEKKALDYRKYGRIILQPAIYFIVLGLGIFIGIQLGQGVTSGSRMSTNEISSQQEFIEAYADSNYINGMQLETLEKEMIAQEETNKKQKDYE